MAYIVFLYGVAIVAGSAVEETASLHPDSRLRRTADATNTEKGKVLMESAPYRGDVLQQSVMGVYNEWSDPNTGASGISNVPAWRENHAAATYARSQDGGVLQDDTEKMMIFGGVSVASNRLLPDTWLYSATVNAWIKPTIDQQPSKRQGHTMTTICKILVVLFGGHGDYSSAFNDTWLFDGTTETWRRLEPVTSGLAIEPRTHHSAVAMYQELSPCKCKESVVIYGGSASSSYHNSCYGDVWELRCVNDSAAQKVYQWFSLQGNSTTSKLSPPSRILQSVFSTSLKKSMYVWGGINCLEQGKFPVIDRLYD